jgi:hypothetical protein
VGKAVLLLLVALMTSGATAETDGRVTDSVVSPLRDGGPAPAPVPWDLADPLLFHEGNRLELEAPDVARLISEDLDRPQPSPLRTGVVLDVEVSPVGQGQWTRLDGGGWTWTMSFAVPGAVALNLRFEPFVLPDGTELRVYGATGLDGNGSPRAARVYRGPIRKKRYATADVYDEEIRVEYRVSSRVDPEEAFSAWRITGIVFGYRGPDGDLGEDFTPSSCHINAKCHEGAWGGEIGATVYLWYLSGPEKENCSGAIMNRVAADFTPIIATANHCGINNTTVTGVHAIWGYETSTCTGGTPPDPNSLPDTLGQVALINHTASDWSLFGTEFDVPSGTLWVGYDATHWPNSSSGTGIHHPMGSYKRISFSNKYDDGTSQSGWQVYWVRHSQGDGLVEVGSSGSAVFDSAHRTRGVLSVTFTPVNCPTGYNDAGYGRMDIAWPYLQPFLDPTDPVYVDRSWTGEEKGTSDKPFNEFLEGAYAVIAGHHLYVEAGNYAEKGTLKKAMIVHATNGTVVLGAGAAW